MKSRLLSVLASIALAVPVVGATTGATVAQLGGDYSITKAASDRAMSAIRSQPVRFEPNLGQANEAASFIVRGPGYAAILTDGGITFVAAGAPQSAQKRGLEALEPVNMDEIPVLAASLRVRGGDLGRAIEPGAPLPGLSNYLKGDRADWVTGVPGYSSLRCRNVYPGIDVVLRGAGSALEYDFEVFPGADPRSVVLELEGSAPFRLDEDGALVMESEAGIVRHGIPSVYQETSGVRAPVAGRYVQLANGVFGFELEAYDTSKTLVIDPILTLSTYLGGNADENGYAISVDIDGRFYVCGYTLSTDFFLFSSVQDMPQGMFDAFVTKFTTGTTPLIVYSTYLGGSQSDFAYGVVADRDLNAYVVGTTSSVNFPTFHPLQVETGDGNQDAFLAKVSEFGDNLVFSTYLGGNSLDQGLDVAVDAAGNAYVSGYTASANFPGSNAVQATYGGNGDGFITAVNAEGTALLYSTFLGGSGVDTITGIDADRAGTVYVTGNTDSPDFPTVSAEQPTLAGSVDAFVAKLMPSGTPLAYSTFLGGASTELASRIAVDGADAVVTGMTLSTDFPTVNPLQSDSGDGLFDAYVTRFSPNGSTHEFSTYLGGNGTDIGADVDVDTDGNIYVTGSTASTNFPTVNFIQTDGDGAAFDAFITEINAAGTGYVFSTYLGGSLDDQGIGIAVSGSGTVVVSGRTLSTNFPLQSNHWADPGDGAADAFVARLGLPQASLSFPSVVIAPDPVVRGGPAEITVTVTNSGPDRSGDTHIRVGLEEFLLDSVSVSQGDFYVISPTLTFNVVVAYFGTIDPGGTASIRLNGRVSTTAPDTFAVFGTVNGSALEMSPMDNEFEKIVDVVTIVPPDITSISSLVTTGKPYRVRITGTNFQPGVLVFVGSDVTPWPSVKYKNTTTLILKGSGLKARFPKGVTVQIRVVNTDTGSDSATFVR